MTNMTCPPIDPAAVNLRIRSIVAEFDTIAAAAKACDMLPAALEGYVSGRNLPGSMALARLCVGLGISADWLLFGLVRP